jgi:hypothetical protein
MSRTGNQMQAHLPDQIAGENLILGVMETLQAFKPTVISASTVIKPTAGIYGGFTVTAVGGATVVSVYDGVDNTGTLLWTGVVVAGQEHNKVLRCYTGIYVEITVSTATVVVDSI